MITLTTLGTLYSIVWLSPDESKYELGDPPQVYDPIPDSDLISEVSSVDITDWRRSLTFPLDFLLKIPEFFIIVFGMIFTGKIFLNLSFIRHSSFCHNGNFYTSVATLSSSVLLQLGEDSLDIGLIGCFSICGFRIVDGFDDKYSETLARLCQSGEGGRAGRSGKR